MGLIGVLGNRKTLHFIQGSSTVIQFDASIKETHERQSTPTKFPLENGKTISDHIIIGPFSLELQGVISDDKLSLVDSALTTALSAVASPLGVVGVGVGLAIFSALAGSESPSVAAYGQLLQLQDNRQPFEVVTSLKRYENMFIESISVPRDKDNSNAIVFTLKVSQLLISKPTTVNINVYADPDLSASQANKGKQETELPNGFAAGVKSITDKYNNLAGSFGAPAVK